MNFLIRLGSMQMYYVIAILFSFLMGSLPFGLLISRSYGVDIRKCGSGNIGATNVYRCVGRFPGILTFLLDIFKGMIPVVLAVYLIKPQHSEISFMYFLGVAAVLGHCFSPFLNGNGGKGVATSFGVMLYLAPIAAIFALGFFVIIFWATRYVSLASIAACGLLMAVSFYSYSWSILTFCIWVICLLIILRHKENIKRLLAGTENKFSRTKPVSNT